MESLLDEPTNLLVLGEWQGSPVGLMCFVIPVEASKDIGAREVERRVLSERTRAFDPFEELEGLDWPHREGERNGPIQLDDRRLFVAQKLVVQDGNLRPVGVSRGQRFGVDRGDRALNLIGARPPHSKRFLDKPSAFLDLRSLPRGSILIPEEYQVALVTGARLAP